MQLTPKIAQMVYGGDYNPEQWPEHIWREDAELMRRAGVNLVSLAIFAWAKLEPRQGDFDFGWLDTVMDLMHEHGVLVNLATATASPPPWLAAAHPEILPVTSSGTRLDIGSRRHYSPHSPIYRERAAALCEAIAERYKDHPALAMWHVDNEYACHFSEDFSPAAATAFRAWLRARYTTVAALNDAWGAAFWGQIYGEWEEIQPPRDAPYLINPGQLLDWKRFSSDGFLACFLEQRAILKRITPAIPVTTNYMNFHYPLDYWAWSPHMDLIANDAYPDPSSPDAPMAGAFGGDLMRSLGRGNPWVLMEQATGHVNWRQRNATKAPGRMRLGSLQALAHGANGVMFFQWRQSYGGGEQFHSAMVPHAGSETRIYREVAALGAELAALTPLLNTQVRPQVAILLDWESAWALDLPGKPSADVRYTELLTQWYAALYRRNIAVDFARPTDDLTRYRLVLAPHLYILAAEAAANLERYVAGGGRLLVSFMSGIVDPVNRIWLGGYPAPLRNLLGLTVEEFAPYGDGQRGEVYTRDEQTFGSELWADVMTLDGAEPLAGYASGWLQDRAALTQHVYGGGQAFYAGTQLDEAGTDWLIGHVAQQAGVAASADAPQGVEISLREGDGRRALFVLNHTERDQRVALPFAGTDVLSGEALDGACQVPPLGARIVVG